MGANATGTARSRRLRAGAWCGGLALALLATVTWAATVGPVSLAPGTVARAALDALPGFSFRLSQAERAIVVDVRLPRVALAAVVGFALAAAGTVMQGFFRNPMADPSIVGVSSGAAVGAVAVIVSSVSVPFGIGRHLAAFAGATVAGFAVYAIATADGRTPVATLLLAGVAIQTFLGAVVSLLMVRADDRSLREATYWLMGNLDAATWTKVAVSLPVALVCTAALFGYARDLNVLLLGEADAGSLGVPVERTKRTLLAVSALLTGAAVSVAGVIGFVGLIVPHAVRLLVGPDHRVLLPAAALAGGTFLVLADTAARTVAGGVPVGVVTAFVGVPFFLFLLRRREVSGL
jgi:iron complex transport system permease protein